MSPLPFSQFPDEILEEVIRVLLVYASFAYASASPCLGRRLVKRATDLLEDRPRRGDQLTASASLTFSSIAISRSSRSWSRASSPNVAETISAASAIARFP